MSSTAGNATPSRWQQRIEGEWIGRPSLFDVNGTWLGFEDIRRASVFADGTTTYYMNGGLAGGGELAGRFALGAPFAFGVRDADTDRIYTGPDFYGSGQPYGGFVDAHYYGPGWQVALNTWNQTMADTQVYSSVLYQGPAVIGVFNGVYTRDPGLADARREHETRCGAAHFVLPTKAGCRYTGSCELWSGDQRPLGEVRIELHVEPVSLLTARHRVAWTGPIERGYEAMVRRDGTRSFHEGPGAWGNATAYGRANYPVLHFADGSRVHGREFMIDAEPGMGAGRTMAVVYQLFEHNRLTAVAHGTLEHG